MGGEIGSESRNPAHSAAPTPGEAPVQVVDDITRDKQDDKFGYAGVYGNFDECASKKIARKRQGNRQNKCENHIVLRKNNDSQAALQEYGRGQD
jgi:hypothetical protein